MLEMDGSFRWLEGMCVVKVVYEHSVAAVLFRWCTSTAWQQCCGYLARSVYVNSMHYIWSNSRYSFDGFRGLQLAVLGMM